MSKTTITCGGDVIFIYAKLTKYERITLGKRIKAAGEKYRPCHWDLYTYLVQEQRLPVLTRSDRTIADELMTMSERQVQKIRQLFRKIGILERRRSRGDTFNRLHPPRLDNIQPQKPAKAATQPAKRQPQTQKNLQTNINNKINNYNTFTADTDTRPTRKQERQQNRQTAEQIDRQEKQLRGYEEYVRNAREKYYQRLPKQEQKKIKQSIEQQLPDKGFFQKFSPARRIEVDRRCLEFISDRVELMLFEEWSIARTEVSQE